MAAPPKKPNVETDAFTAAEVRAKLRCSKAFFYKEIRLKRLRSFLRNHNRWVYKSSFDAYKAMTEAEGLNPDGTARLDGWRKKKKK